MASDKKRRYDMGSREGRLAACREAVAEGMRAALDMRCDTPSEMNAWAHRTAESMAGRMFEPNSLQWAMASTLYELGLAIAYRQTVWEVLRGEKGGLGPVDEDYDQWAQFVCDRIQIVDDGKPILHTEWQPHGPDEPWNG